MNLQDEDIITKSHIESDTIIVNQCGYDGYNEYDRNGHKTRIFSVNDKGLTKSRNYAIKHSEADVCLLCDDDEVFSRNYEEGLLTAYRDLPEADVIILSIVNNNVYFDEHMGAGSGNGAEEEFRFLTDCRKNGLAIYYVPFVIADVAQTKSTWFKGYNEEFFINRGNTTRYIMGYVPAVLYAAYYSIRKRHQFDSDISWFKAFRLIMKGIHENRLGKKK